MEHVLRGVPSTCCLSYILGNLSIGTATDFRTLEQIGCLRLQILHAMEVS